MAGNARKSPPTAGPNRFATSPAKTVHIPPKRNLIAYSCGFVSRSKDRSTLIISVWPHCQKPQAQRNAEPYRHKTNRRYERRGLLASENLRYSYCVEEKSNCAKKQRSRFDRSVLGPALCDLEPYGC